MECHSATRVVHEVAVCDQPFSSRRLEGDYLVQSRRLGGRNLDPQKYQRDVDLLMAEVERNPNDARSVFYIARSYNCLRDWTNTRTWYLRRAEMGGWEEEVFYSLWRAGTAMEMLGSRGHKCSTRICGPGSTGRVGPSLSTTSPSTTGETSGGRWADCSQNAPRRSRCPTIRCSSIAMCIASEPSMSSRYAPRGSAEPQRRSTCAAAYWPSGTTSPSEHPRIMSNWEFLAKKLMEQTKEYPAALVPTLAAEAKTLR